MATGAGGAVVDLPGLRLRQREELAHVPHRQRRMHHHQQRTARHHPDIGEVGDRLVWQPGPQGGIGHEGGLDVEHAVAIAGRPGDGLGADDAAAARTVFNDDLLAETGAHGLRRDARQHIVAGPGREGHYQANRLGWPGLGLCLCGTGGDRMESGGKDCGKERGRGPGAQERHRSPPRCGCSRGVLVPAAPVFTGFPCHWRSVARSAAIRCAAGAMNGARPDLRRRAEDHCGHAEAGRWGRPRTRQARSTDAGVTPRPVRQKPDTGQP